MRSSLRLRGNVRDVLRRSDWIDLVGEGNLYGLAHAAILAFLEEQPITTQGSAREETPKL